MSFVQQHQSWIHLTAAPACLFDSHGFFTLGECKILGLGLDAWASIFGITLLSIVAWLFGPLRRIVKRGFTAFLNWRFLRGIGHASGSRVAILLVRLEGDDETQALRETIREGIKRELGDAIEIITWPNSVHLAEGNDTEAERRSLNTLQGWLKKTSCDLAIWGRVKADDVISLRYTVTDFGSRLPETYKLTETLELPTRFIQTLGIVLAIRVCAPEWSVHPRSDFTEYLLASAKRLEPLLNNAERTFEPDVTATLMVSYGQALLTVGQQTNSLNHIRKAIDAYRGALNTFERDRWPRIWESLSISLAMATGSLGQREGDPRLFEESLSLYGSVLETIDPDNNLIKWGAIKTDLGTTLCNMGRLQQGGSTLREASSTLKDVVSRCTREKTPHVWGYTTISLAVALQSLGELESVDDLQNAVGCFHAALELWQRNRAPHLWASVHNMLSNTYRLLGERNLNANDLAKAIKHARNSLKERKRRSEPFLWGESQNNLGISYLALAKTRSQSGMARKALRALQRASNELTLDRSFPDWLMTRINLGHAQTVLGTLSNRSEPLWAALEIYEDALLLADPKKVPFHGAMLLNNLGAARCELGRVLGRIESFEEAFRSHNTALRIYNWKNAAYYSERTMRYIGHLLRLLGAKDDPQSVNRWLQLMEAISSFSGLTNAVEELKRLLIDVNVTEEPDFSALCRFHIALQQRYVGEMTGNRAVLSDARQYLSEVLNLWTREQWPLQWARAQVQIANICVREVERGANGSLLAEAFSRYQGALVEQKRGRVPVDWATAKISLGLAYCVAGMRWQGYRAVYALFRGIREFKKALAVITMKSASAPWALAKNNLGITYLQLAQMMESMIPFPRIAKTITLTLAKKATNSLQEALRVYTRELYPLYWAMAKFNLANAYNTLGSDAGDRNLLRNAAAAATDALEVYTPQCAPLMWAMAQVSWASAIAALGEMDADMDSIHGAISTFRTAIETLKQIGAGSELRIAEANLATAVNTLERMAVTSNSGEVGA